MLSVALTGNVAAGKSTVLAQFAHWGATVVDTDQLAREAVAPGRPALRAILARFGDDLALADGSLDRALLRRRVMGDDERRAVLNAIVHPDVMRLHAERLEVARKAGVAIVVSDIPLLFEALDPDAWDVVVLVDAPEETRRRRLVELRGYSDEEARDVMDAQLPSRFKRAKSHIVIDNDGSLEALQANARAAWQALVTEAGRRRNARR
ncbi:MAG TPA: dephospho-CoA kinase [Gemmatimonadales bacterium]|nr:dephospho-CoA kinase [Gemmatimonadales bacterium]